MNQPPPMPGLTDEQREALSAHIAKVNEQLRAIVEAVQPAVRAAAEQMVQLAKALQPLADTTPYDKCQCTSTHAGLDLCARCPGNSPKEPR